MASEEIRTAPLDLVIIGGGPAGMSAALTAGRALLSTVVVNAESPRNAVTTASHGFLTRDGVHPTELLAVSKAQLEKYDTARYVCDTVTAATANAAGFELMVGSGDTLETAQLIIATGHTDVLARLELPGIEAVYGRSVYPCVFCDAFEHRSERIALFGSEGAILYAPMARLWTEDLFVFTNGAPVADEDKAACARNGVHVHTEAIRQLESKDGQLLAIELANGERVECDAGFIADDYSEPASTFAESLGVAIAENEWGMQALDVTEAGSTSVTGLHVIGDARTGFSGLLAAAAEGAVCVETIVHEMAAKRWSSR